MKRANPTLPPTRESNLAAPVPVIRRAVVDDARAIAEISVVAWRAAYRGMLPRGFLAGLAVQPRAAAWESMLESDADGASPAWVVERAGRIIGYASTGPPRDDDVPIPTAEVYAVYVLPEAWRTGCGRALLSAAAAEWRARGTDTLVLWVLEHNAPARQFYEAMGWAPDGLRQQIDLGGIAPTELRYRVSLRSPIDETAS
jgi:GNAT superfamily N-acetyltransferase